MLINGKFKHITVRKQSVYFVYNEFIDILFLGCLVDKISFCLFVDTCV